MEANERHRGLTVIIAICSSLVLISAGDLAVIDKFNITSDVNSRNNRVLNGIFGSCLPSERHGINCTMDSVGSFGKDFRGHCVDGGVVRFTGEFKLLYIRCVAPFHMDFDYDGFQPTEAIKVTIWKEVNPLPMNRNISGYHMDLQVYSNQGLYERRRSRLWETNRTEQLQNLTKYVYPRTGKFNVRKLSNSSMNLPFYIFFEEPSLAPTFMFNNFTKTSYQSPGQLTIPCRSSHASSGVELYKSVDGVRRQVQHVDYKPWIGFTVFKTEGEINGTEEYECSFVDEKLSTLKLSFPPDPLTQFGFDAIFPQQYQNNRVTINHEANAVTREPLTVNITCVVQTNDPYNYMSSIGSNNPVHMRLTREFILPEFSNNSYHRKKTMTLVGDSYPYELKIFRAHQTGITYCVSGRYSRIYEYAAGLNRKMYQLDFGTDYANLPHTSPPKEVHIHLEVFNMDDTTLSQALSTVKTDTVKLIVGNRYTFSCRVDTFTIARTIIWEVGFNNGTISRVKMDYNFVGEFSYLNWTATYTLEKVSCMAPFWNNDRWRADDLYTIVGEDESNTEEQRYLIVICSSLAFVFLVVGGTCCMLRRMRNIQKWEFSKLEIIEFEQGNPSVKAELALSEGGNHLPYDKRYEIPEGDFEIDYSHELGSGEFGVVYNGIVNGQPVAVKTVKPNVDKAFTKALLSELKIMIYLGKHDNLLSIVGASTSNLRHGSVLIFLELCTLGSLESFLRKNRHNLRPEESPYMQIGYSSDGYDEYELEAYEVSMSEFDLYVWSHQIALGMEYLSSKKVIHGDLATRNVLLTETKVAKLCDFGLSRRLHNYKIYAKNPSSQPLPWPWMAPEALRNLVFSTQTDVWAFGITLWEIFSLGEFPYPGISHSLDFADKLREGMRNIKPRLAPDTLYREVMKECWRYHPEDRPSFNELCFTLENLLASYTTMELPALTTSSESGIASTSAAAAGGYVVHTLTYAM